MRSPFLFAFVCLSTVMAGAQSLFNSPVNLAVSETYLSALADFNGDGLIDIASTSTTSGRVLIHYRNSSGSYAFPPSSYNVGGSWVYSVQATDLNKDGYPDLTFTGYNGSIQPCVSVMLNNGSGGFGSAQNYVTGQGLAFYHTLGDLNKDGNPDLVTANYYSNNITIYTGSSNGTFSNPVSIKALYAFDVNIRDYDQDGNPDIVVSSPDNNQFIFFKGTGSTSSYSTISYLNTGNRPGNISSADFNGDGYPDIAMGSGANASVYVHLASSGSFGSAQTLGKAPQEPAFMPAISITTEEPISFPQMNFRLRFRFSPVMEMEVLAMLRTTG